MLLAGLGFSVLSAAVFLNADSLALLDLYGPRRRARATLMATLANMGGLGCGPLLAGLLSQWAGSPLRQIFWVDLALLVPQRLVSGPCRSRSRRRAVRGSGHRGCQFRPRCAGHSRRRRLVLAGVIAGVGLGLSFRAGLAAVNASSPVERHGQVASGFFVVMYLAFWVTVIGEGVLAQLIGLRAAGPTFAAVVAALSAVVLVLVRHSRRAAQGVHARGRPIAGHVRGCGV